VLLRVRACAVCRTDLHIVDGELPLPRLPLVPGHEIVATVEALGAGVTAPHVGERVGVPWLGGSCGHCAYCSSQAENLCDDPVFTGYTCDGGFATHVLADARYCYSLAGLVMDDASAAPLLCAGLIGWRALKAAGEAPVLGLYGFGAAAHLIAQVAIALTARLQQLDAGNAGAYAARAKDFAQRWQQAMVRWAAKATPLQGLPVVSQHKAFSYLYDWLGMREVAVLEPKPGVEPSVSHLQQVLASLKAQPARLVVYAAYQDARPSEWLHKNAGMPAVRLPFTVGGSDGAKDLFGLFDDTVDRLLAAAGAAK